MVLVVAVAAIAGLCWLFCAVFAYPVQGDATDSGVPFIEYEDDKYHFEADENCVVIDADER